MMSKLKYPQKDATQCLDSNLLGSYYSLCVNTRTSEKGLTCKAVRLQMEVFSGRIDMAVYFHYFQTASCS